MSNSEQLARVQSSYQGDAQQINTEDIKGNRSIGCQLGGDVCLDKQHLGTLMSDRRTFVFVCASARVSEEKVKRRGNV